jgi:hypothetical protein
MKNYPKQRLSYNEKMKNDAEWAKDVIDSLLIQDVSDRTTVVNDRYKSDYERMLSNYQLFNNQLNQKDYERECEPYGLEVGQYQDEIQPYNKTYNKIQVLLGEELRRPMNHRAVLIDPDGIRSKLAFHDTLLHQFVMSEMQTTIQQVIPNFDPELVQNTSERIMNPEEINRYMKLNYSEAREIKANKLLNYLNRYLLIPEYKNDSYKHGLISGVEVAYIGVHNNEPSVEVINPLGFFYHKSPETKYIQDGLYAGFRTYMTSGDVLDKFGDFLTSEQVDKIDRSRHGGFRDGMGETWPYYHGSQYLTEYRDGYYSEGSYSKSDSIDDWLVQHVEWRSQRKVGFLRFINEYGDEQVDIVSEDFEVPQAATKSVANEDYNTKVTYHNWSSADGNQFSLNWGWIPEVWTGVRIGHDMYTMIGPKDVQFRTTSNPLKVKLGYHGVIYNAMNATPVSLMDRMKPFQYLYFIIMHKLKKLIAQDKGKIFHLDSTMVDPKMGWEKTLYYLTQMNLDIYNPLQNADQPGWAQRGKVTGSTDMSTIQHIANYVDLLNALDAQISDVAGVNRQREGQVGPTEAVTNAQTNITMSAVITEPYSYLHDKNWEQILSSLLQAAQVAYKGKHVVKQYVLDDLSVSTIEISPDELADSDLGIFISNSYKDEMTFQKLEGLAQALVQNDRAKFSDLIKMLNSSSAQELESHIIQSEQKAEQQAQQQFEAQMQAQQAEREDENFNKERDREVKVQVAEIQAFSRQMDLDSDDNNIPDHLEIEKFKTDASLKTRKLDLEEFKAKNQIRQKDEELKIKRKAPAKSK